MYTDWSEIAEKRKWNAAKYWEETMDKLGLLSGEPEIIPEVESEPASQPERAIETLSKEQKRSRKAAATLLARNPNHFKELSAKAHQRRKIIAGI